MQRTLRVEVISTLEALLRFETEWTTLEHRAIAGEWFAGPRYLLPLIETYFPDRQLAVYCVYDSNELIGVLPLVHGVTDGLAGCRPTIGFPMHAHVRRIGLLASRDPRAVAEAAFVDMRKRGTSCVLLQQIEAASALDGWLKDAGARARLGWFDTRQSDSAMATWPDGWESYLEGRDGKLLRNLRSRHRKLEQDGFSFEVNRTLDQFTTAWPMVLDIESRSWKHGQRTSIANEPGTAMFYEKIGQRLAGSGALRLYVLEQAGRGIAHAFGAQVLDRFYLLKNSYDEAFKRWSPGVALVWQSMQDTARAGHAEYDFLGDVSDWKRDFATAETSYLTRRLFSASSIRCQACRLREETLKPLARRIGVKRLLARVGVPRR